ncbi:MAG: FMN-binding negative transcriptional regulator [Acidimicrobiales bacterium]
MIIHEWDAGTDQEWRAFIDTHGFGDLIAAGRGRELPVVVSTQFVLIGDEVLMHLAGPNPIWSAVAENPRVLLSVSGDWTYIPSAWKAIGSEDPTRGIPTTYYASVQIVGTAHIVDDPVGVADVLRRQLAHLQPDTAVIDPLEHGARLRSIRALRVDITDVRAKFKYGGNVDAAHRMAVADLLAIRDGPNDRAALSHLRRRLETGAP